MRIAIIALILAVAALGVGSFATFTSLNDDAEPIPLAAESGWSVSECLRADASLDTLDIGCIQGDCGPYADMIQAINDNCP